MKDEYIGVIKMFGAEWAPRGWKLCNGQLLEITQFEALYSVIGTTYGGDGKNNFALPDLRGRVPIGCGSGPGLSPHHAGHTGGTETTALRISHLPAHSHQATVNNFQVKIQASDQAGTKSTPGAGGARTLAAGAGEGRGVNLYNHEQPVVTLRTETEAAADVGIKKTGEGKSFSKIQPYLAINFIICSEGIYPSRN
ncbi:phage tail protein [Fodinibius salsisoli]|uniref:Phage tail protein n=1 Tax=Fodinibius salsisoli TaxID=2820877 RepID=A0ABT3PTJ0_9BACT|nr:tail fiber protein [Fodinibius salsisoli]MCW9709178.1 phage tail protein [Fodinibius salsisoli]